MLKLTTDKHEASRGLSVTAELLVTMTAVRSAILNFKIFAFRPMSRDLYCHAIQLHCAKFH